MGDVSIWCIVAGGLGGSQRDSPVTRCVKYVYPAGDSAGSQSSA